jgi:hypothetical protein
VIVEFVFHSLGTINFAYCAADPSDPDGQPVAHFDGKLHTKHGVIS